MSNHSEEYINKLIFIIKYAEEINYKLLKFHPVLYNGSNGFHKLSDMSDSSLKINSKKQQEIIEEKLFSKIIFNNT